MELCWKFNIPDQILSIKIDEDLSYQALQGCRQGVIKKFNDNKTTLSYDEWQEEKHWLSSNYSNIVGELVEPSQEQKDSYRKKVSHITDDPGEPSHGISPDGWAYDRMQRKSSWLQNAESNLMVEIGRIENVGIFETPDGINVFKRSWCDYEKTYYNTMPCCIFPDNPGWQKSSIEELEQYDLDINSQWVQENLSNVQKDLLELLFILPQ